MTAPATLHPALAEVLVQRGHEMAANDNRIPRALIKFSDPTTEEPIGELALRDGALVFEGRADESAMLLFNELVARHDAAIKALADIVRGTHEGHRDGMVLVGTTAVTRDGLRRGAAVLGLEPPVFDGRG